VNALRAVVTSERIEIYRDAAPDRPILVQRTPANGRPFIHPIVAPDGRGELTEDAPPHHPWQHGLYVGLNDVNGVGFWTEQPTDGAFRAAGHEVWVRPQAVTWSVTTQWLAPGGERVLKESQVWTLRDHGNRFLLDLSWMLFAPPDQVVRFGKYAYGGLFLRMPWRPETGGRVVTSESRSGAVPDGGRARWVAVSMPVPGRDDPVGIAILDHPTNAEHPVPWRVDGQLGVSPSRCIASGWELAPTEFVQSSYRLSVFCGETDPSAVEERWRAFAKE
jgi:hypothetical protein